MVLKLQNITNAKAINSNLFKFIRKLLFLLASLMMLCGCSSNEPESTIELHEIELSVAEKSVVSHENDFAITMFDTFSEDENIVFSPLSAACNLSLIANASDGQTREQIVNALGFNDIEILNVFNEKLLSGIGRLDSKKIKMSLANAIWLNKKQNVSLNDAVLNVALKDYKSKVTTTVFNANTYKSINKWASDKTNGLIPDFYKEGELSSLDYAVVLNALYFKGEFTSKFDKGKTAEAEFIDADGVKSRVNFMNDTRAVPYLNNESAKAISLDFGNGAFEMILALPNNNATLTQAAKAAMQLKSLSQQKIVISIPKLCIAQEFFLDNVYKSLDIDAENAILSGIMVDNKPLKCSKIHTKQKTVFAIDETGAEGASVTGTDMIGASGDYKIPEFIANRPFVLWFARNLPGL